MKYICLVYPVEKDRSAMTKREADAWTDQSLASDEVLRKAGHLIMAHALQPVEEATTVRVRNGKLSATDGPFPETKGQLGVQVAAKFPVARRGSIEVRPIRELRP
jgi:hypothetical protein